MSFRQKRDKVQGFLLYCYFLCCNKKKKLLNTYIVAKNNHKIDSHDYIIIFYSTLGSMLKYA